MFSNVKPPSRSAKGADDNRQRGRDQEQKREDEERRYAQPMGWQAAPGRLRQATLRAVLQ